MDVLYFSLSGIAVIATLIPFINHTHWFFRIFEYGIIQLAVFQVIVMVFGFVFVENDLYVIIAQASLLLCFSYNASIIIPYMPFYGFKPSKKAGSSAKPITLITANVYQFNKNYQKFIDLIKDIKPDIFLTIESNKNWEKALSVLDKDFPNHHKLPLENTYGMHFYTTLKINNLAVHYFVAKDVPCIEASLETKDGFRFTFYGIHPPPPSPSEEDNSKERDGELLALAKKIKKDNSTTIVAGDFNNVPWTKSSWLFKKMAKMVDPRIGRGLFSTFHAKYRFLRFPLDQLYHSDDIIINELKVLQDIDSDHLPLFCSFSISLKKEHTEIDVADSSEIKEANQIIKEGKENENQRDSSN